MAKILITGGSGLVGTAISELLIKKGHEPVWLSREEGRYNNITKYKWSLADGYIDEKAFENTKHIIHLAGAGIADHRWTSAYKKEIIASRAESSRLLFKYISKNNYKIKTLVGGSAIGFYGSQPSEHVFTENDPPGHDFLAETCVLWENSYRPFAGLGIRTPVVRTGMVLSSKGGAYKKMKRPFQLGLGAVIGNGKQYIPWVHVHDLAPVFVHLLFNDHLNGVYNGVATEMINNSQFSKQLAANLHKPLFLPHVPKFVLKLAMGESSVMVTEGLKISNQKLKDSGFKFEFEKLSEALKDLAH